MSSGGFIPVTSAWRVSQLKAATDSAMWKERFLFLMVANRRPRGVICRSQWALTAARVVKTNWFLPGLLTKCHIALQALRSQSPCSQNVGKLSAALVLLLVLLL